VHNITIMTCYLAWSRKRVSHLISTHRSTMISIINQIQGSITGEAIDRLDRYDEMQCDDKQDKVYKRQNTSSSSNQAIGMTNTKIPPRKEAKQVASRGLVKMSANCFSISMYFITMSPFSTWSLKKWYLTFMFFPLP
jgi:hypothetical protein